MQELNKLNETLFYQTQNKKKKSNMQNIKKKNYPREKAGEETQRFYVRFLVQSAVLFIAVQRRAW